MTKSQLRYVADLKNLEEHEEELRLASLSAAQAKIVATMLVCYPNARRTAKSPRLDSCLSLWPLIWIAS